ncbi:XRE family transcriptional regulator [Glutamicibacter mishrai]|uniref:XRE family transcriptional regulator n=2 Tax=Glutamicibacter mishrai TaxID=1775880 RepID=A0A6H0SJE3_9MICC|nr:XRE family transcriptional regulator [Glutamicibacter mishrai]
METTTMKLRINGTAVRVIREALGVRAVDLAARSEITKSTLSHVEKGARQVSPATLRKIAIGLGVPTEAISYPDFVQSVAA